MARTVIMDHPLIQHKIGIIRKKDTSSKELRPRSAFGQKATDKIR